MATTNATVRLAISVLPETKLGEWFSTPKPPKIAGKERGVEARLCWAAQGGQGAGASASSTLWEVCVSFHLEKIVNSCMDAKGCGPSHIGNRREAQAG